MDNTNNEVSAEQKAANFKADIANDTASQIEAKTSNLATVQSVEEVKAENALLQKTTR